MDDLAGKVACVTGAAQGLGASFALALASRGARVAVGDIASTDVVYKAAVAGGGEALGGYLDVTDPRSVSGFFDQVIERFGKIDILVNNAALAGALKPKLIGQIESQEWDRVLAVNTRGVFECTKYVISAMKRNGYGKIINIASGTAIKGAPGMLHYVASKGAVISMTRAMARELGDDGIRVNCIAPGLTMSDSMRDNPDWPADVMEKNIATRALKRQADPQDLIGAMFFLSSSASDFVTGQTLSVDGGSVMN
ncbi:SDR family NAD(P)-dependent oxidoreductase [Bradyrhizobium canariense]|uniref:NAD(P)-dependent dehydrogenase, short-chain alcohol dehydrogenase family n=1 Tax=Bradyrhizobium canariense TaxID=255045 RepID=A0A1H1XNQ4_9BRAD|nr:glucose 1-dehydrogenase [Bradyrhizobium canariense]SDT10813.1 NAD(P)-dependent dehydrogenase, short-chain alcohol dehydrogenase family [Bradyrhizobium canariense]